MDFCGTRLRIVWHGRRRSPIARLAGAALATAVVVIVAGAGGAGLAAETPPGPHSSTDDPCSGGLLEKVQEDYLGMESFSGRFVQEDRRENGRTQTASGKIDYRKPGRMRWHYLEPNEQLVVTNGEKVWLFDPLLDNVTVQPLKGLTQGTPLAFLLGLGKLTRDFSCRALTNTPPADGLTYLELLPRKPIPGLAFIQLGVAGQAGRIGALRMVDSRGNIRLLRLIDLKPGAVFAKGHFIFKITEGMEVISK